MLCYTNSNILSKIFLFQTFSAAISRRIVFIDLKKNISTSIVSFVLKHIHYQHFNCIYSESGAYTARSMSIEQDKNNQKPKNIYNCVMSTRCCCAMNWYCHMNALCTPNFFFCNIIRVLSINHWSMALEHFEACVSIVQMKSTLRINS